MTDAEPGLEDSIRPPSRESLATSVIAGLAARVWTALLGFIAPPIYLRLMGSDAYGLVGVFSTLGYALSMLDLGLSTTLNREVSQLQDTPGRAARLADLVRTFEWVYLGVAAASLIVCVGVAPLVANYWITSTTLDRNEIVMAVALMGLVIASQWHTTLYTGLLQGLHLQLRASVLQLVSTTAKTLGALGLLVYVSATPAVFFQWQAATAIGTSLLAAALSWQAVARPFRHARFQRSILLGKRSFATDVWLLSLTGIGLAQIDKVVVGRWGSLQDLGYYSLATTVSGTMFLITGPIFGSFFPRISALAVGGSRDELLRLYKLGTQMMLALAAPAAATFFFFGEGLLHLWARDPNVVSQITEPARVLVIAAMLHGVTYMPYMLALAFGLTRPMLFVNVALLVVLIPTEIFLVRGYGLTGAAMGWLFVVLATVLASAPIVHRIAIPGATPAWLARDVLAPILAGWAAVAAVWYVLPSTAGFVHAGQAVAAGSIGLTAIIATSPELRRSMRARYETFVRPNARPESQ